jgi:predicted transcriptional regulator
MDRSRSWLVNEAVEQYLEHQDWMDLKTEEAIADIEADGKLVAHEDVMARLEDEKAPGR